MTESPKAKYRNYPMHTLGAALLVAKTIRDHMAGKPMNRLLLADALGIKPSSSNFRALLSSSLKYGLTVGTEKAEDIALTELGSRAITPSPNQPAAMRKAATTPPTFGQFYADYNNNRVPTSEMFAKILSSKYGVPEINASECATIITTNGEKVGIIRPISGSAHVILGMDDEIGADVELDDDPETTVEPAAPASAPTAAAPYKTAAPMRLGDTPGSTTNGRPKPIFLGHGRKVGPREKLEHILRGFKIPFSVAVSEPNLGKPIPTKVRETMFRCSSAILIFTKDQKFFDEEGKEIWRASENVVYELGAASLLYEDRIVIFKERGIDLASNFGSIGYIEFEEDGIEAKTVDLLKELIGFGLVTVTPTA